MIFFSKTVPKPLYLKTHYDFWSRFKDFEWTQIQNQVTQPVLLSHLMLSLSFLFNFLFKLLNFTTDSPLTNHDSYFTTGKCPQYRSYLNLLNWIISLSSNISWNYGTISFKLLVSFYDLLESGGCQSDDSEPQGNINLRAQFIISTPFFIYCY